MVNHCDFKVFNTNTTGKKPDKVRLVLDRNPNQRCVKDLKEAVNYSLKGSKTLVKSRFLDLFLQKYRKG